mgnify:CR=1 FL=1
MPAAWQPPHALHAVVLCAERPCPCPCPALRVQFKPAPPLRLGSDEYVAQLQEVYELGRKGSASRTREQTDTVGCDRSPVLAAWGVRWLPAHAC